MPIRMRLPRYKDREKNNNIEKSNGVGRNKNVSDLTRRADAATSRQTGGTFDDEPREAGKVKRRDASGD